MIYSRMTYHCRLGDAAISGNLDDDDLTVNVTADTVGFTLYGSPATVLDAIDAMRAAALDAIKGTSYGYLAARGAASAPERQETCSSEAAKNAAWQFNEAVSMLRSSARCARFGAGDTELADEIDEGLPAMHAALEALVQAVPA